MQNEKDHILITLHETKELAKYLALEENNMQIFLKIDILLHYKTLC